MENNKLKVISYPDPRLKDLSAPWDFTDPMTSGKLEDITEQMIELSLRIKGFGIAAIQVGIACRFCVVTLPDSEPYVLINPEIIESSEPYMIGEGCLSLYGANATIERFRQVQFKFQDVEGTFHQAVAESVEAQVIQHEIDHMDGKLFIDHLSPQKRGMVVKRYKKIMKGQERHGQHVDRFI